VRYATHQLQAAFLHARDPPLQVMNIDLDVVGNRLGAGAGEFGGMAAILLACEFSVKLLDAAVNRLQFQDLRGRWLPCGKRHSFEVFQNAAGVHGVGLGSLHARPGGPLPARPWTG
jgi:hypothetical protein